jgi:DNA mismatch repair protein MutS
MLSNDLSPLMRQYHEIKKAHRDAILFFRVGDFYEMFYEDAEQASKLLSIALTSRDKSRPDPVPLCGVPYHAATGYIAKLLKAGRTVALCDQVEDPKAAKGLVRREVVRLYTPGTLVDAEFLPPDESSFLSAVISRSSKKYSQTDPILGLASLDVSTGEFWLQEFVGPQAESDLQDELTRIDPREVLYPSGAAHAVVSAINRLKRARLTAQEPSWFGLEAGVRLLQEQFRIPSLSDLGCKDMTLSVQAAGALLRYLRETQPAASLGHLHRIQVRRTAHAMHLDAATIRNLELIRPLNEEHRESTLLSVLDRTMCSMGSRLLRDWIIRPLVSVATIENRLQAVESLVTTMQIRESLRQCLRDVRDLARVNARIAVGLASPRDLLAVKESAAALPEIEKLLKDLNASYFRTLSSSWDNLTDVYELIEGTIRLDAPLSTRDGGIIKDGYDVRLDDLKAASRDGKGWIAKLETQERLRTGIESLKIRFNQVFGYYIEVTKANLARVPLDYIRKQTLTNAERFTTPELAELEERVAGAELKLGILEREIFESVRSQIGTASSRIEAMSCVIATVDVLASFAETAVRNQYVRPTVDDSGNLSIIEGRHPVIEQMDLAGGFIANDTSLDLQDNRLLLITGPNMAGKSTYLRQVALITLMAQMGSFVPARSARIGLVDRIFTRVGASDNVAAGQSTFMVEMTETAQILHCATVRSLILLDEIGRGTSTYDGLSIAWAVAEYIQDRLFLGSRTLYATHYHEMTQLAHLREGIKNYTVAVAERNDEVLFLRKIIPGGADRSYGIHVARLAGLPVPIISRAREVLAQLEGSTNDNRMQVRSSDIAPPDPSLPPPHPIIEEVRQMDLFSMTPIEAMNRLADLQRRLEGYSSL